MPVPTLQIISHPPSDDLPACAGGAETFPGQAIFEWIVDPVDTQVQFRIDGGPWTPCEQPLAIDMSSGEHIVEFRIDPEDLIREDPPAPGEPETYVVDDIVLHDSVVYIANTSTLDEPPSVDWDVFDADDWTAGPVYNDGDIVDRFDYTADAWSAVTTYTYGNTVYYSGSTYKCIVDSSLNDTPPSVEWEEYIVNYICVVANSQTTWFSPDWNVFNPPAWGQWVVGDTVTLGLIEYICVADTNTIPPTADWEVLGAGVVDQAPIKYQPGDYVQRDGRNWLCTIATTLAPPSVGWSLFTPPAYTPPTVYHYGDLVRYLGENYICVVADSDTVWFSPDWSEWTPELFGRWHVGDQVARAGINYICIADTNDRPPTSAWRTVGDTEGPPGPEVETDESTYNIGDVVQRDSIIYECTVNGTENPPPGAGWSVFSPDLWTIGVIYNEDDIVYKVKVDSDGNPMNVYYICTVATSLPVWFSGEWNEFSPERYGAWHVGDQVELGDDVYECIHDTNYRPPSPDWEEFVEEEVEVDTDEPRPDINVTVGGADVSQYFDTGVVNGSSDSDVSRQASVSLIAEPSELGTTSTSPLPKITLGQPVVIRYSRQKVFVGQITSTGSSSRRTLSFDAQSLEVLGVGSYKATSSKTWAKGTAVSTIITDIVRIYMKQKVAGINISGTVAASFTLGFGDNPWTVAEDLAESKNAYVYFNRNGEVAGVKKDSAPTHNFSPAPESSDVGAPITEFTKDVDGKDFYDTVLITTELPDGSTINEIATTSTDGMFRVSEVPFELTTEFPDKEDYTSGSAYCSDFKAAIVDAKAEVKDAAQDALNHLPRKDAEVSMSFECAVDVTVEPGDIALFNGGKSNIMQFSIPLGPGNMSIGTMREAKSSVAGVRL